MREKSGKRFWNKWLLMAGAMLVGVEVAVLSTFWFLTS